MGTGTRVDNKVAKSYKTRHFKPEQRDKNDRDAKRAASLTAQATEILRAEEVSAKAARREAAEMGMPEVARSSVKPSSGNQVRSSHGRFNLKGVVEVLLEQGFNPAEKILEVMPQLEPDVQAKMAAELLKYVQPQLKSIEHTGRNGGPIELMAMPYEQRQARIAELVQKSGRPELIDGLVEDDDGAE